jgi:hypothetical protein
VFARQHVENRICLVRAGPNARKQLGLLFAMELLS